MFDKLIVSDEQGAEFKGRGRYFMVSTVVVGILFVTAVVFSLYAADIGLGSDQFEVSMIVAPVTPTAPEPPKPMQVQDQPQTSQSDKPSRIENILRPEESPGEVPTNISVTRNTHLSRPPGDYILNGIDKVGAGAPDGGPGRSETIGSSSSATSGEAVSPETIPDPPPVIKTKPPVRTISKGVITGQAKSLPPPPYPAAARAIHAQGTVSVQITIDESGKVISSKAIDGHPLLRNAAEKAAWSAKFGPTFLSEVPVKVTGIIVYNFKTN